MGLGDQAWLRFCLTLRVFIEALIYPRHVSRGLGMEEILFNELRYVALLIYPRQGFEVPGMTEILFNP